MNNTYKRVEVQVKCDEYNETFLIWNEGQYACPYLHISFPVISPDGRLCWYEGCPILGEKLGLWNYYETEYEGDEEHDVQDVINHVFKVIDEHKVKLYNNPDKKFKLGDVEIETVGINNSYIYNK